MPRYSAGLLVYRIAGGALEVFLGHPGGPFWARKDDGVWSIPKGEYTDDEDPWDAARREFTEEVGMPAPDGPPIGLAPVKQPGGKVVTAFAMQADLDTSQAVSNTFTMEWPPKSGTLREYPELDRVGYIEGQLLFLVMTFEVHMESGAINCEPDVAGGGFFLYTTESRNA